MKDKQIILNALMNEVENRKHEIEVLQKRMDMIIAEED